MRECERNEDNILSHTEKAFYRVRDVGCCWLHAIIDDGDGETDVEVASMEMEWNEDRLSCVTAHTDSRKIKSTHGVRIRRKTSINTATSATRSTNEVQPYGLRITVVLVM